MYCHIKIYNFYVLTSLFSKNTHSEKNKYFKNKNLGEHNDNYKCSTWTKVTVPPLFEMSLSYHSMLFPLTVMKTDGKQTTDKPTKYKNKK